MDENKYDFLIQKYSAYHKLPWILIKAQVWRESNFDPRAISPCGACGLMQIMPLTGKDLGLAGEDFFDPEKNIAAGIHYDKIQYDHFPEIPDTNEKLKFMLASYNCGRGYVNAALLLARKKEFGFNPLVASPGKWQTWEYSSKFLASPQCIFVDRRPDYQQVKNYVESIWKKYQDYLSAETKEETE